MLWGADIIAKEYANGVEMVVMSFLSHYFFNTSITMLLLLSIGLVTFSLALYNYSSTSSVQYLPIRTTEDSDDDNENGDYNVDERYDGIMVKAYAKVNPV